MKHKQEHKIKSIEHNNKKIMKWTDFFLMWINKKINKKIKKQMKMLKLKNNKWKKWINFQKN